MLVVLFGQIGNHTLLSLAFASSSSSVSVIVGKEASLQAMQSFYQVPTHSSCFFFIPDKGESDCSWKEGSYYLHGATYYRTGLEQLVCGKYLFYFSLILRTKHFGIPNGVKWVWQNKAKTVLQWVLAFKYVTIYLYFSLAIWFWLLLQVRYNLVDLQSDWADLWCNFYICT